MAKKKRPVTSSTSSEIDDKSSSTNSQTDSTENNATKMMVFKNPNFVHSSKNSSSANKKPRYWKNLKQIMATERSLLWESSSSNYSNIEAPPSFFPAKKYSDISGLPASYMDPQTKLRYFSSDEFSRIRILPADIVTGYLTLRKANPCVP